MQITDDVIYVGVNDHKIDLFEGQYVVPNGISYNSYVILDDKIAVFDTVDLSFTEEWFNNLEKTLNGKQPDYLIVQHMEPDHSANIVHFMNKYPRVTIVSSNKSFVMMKNYFDCDYLDRGIVVGEGDSLVLGKHELTFIAAPMVHWPEVIVTYDKKDRILFSADAFGKFGALDVEDEWACEARRYYFGIVGKYGAQVQALLKKIANLNIDTICPLHGPMLCENLEYYLGLYNTWSSYMPEEKGVMIAYTSVYGNTKKAVQILAEKLEKLGCEKVVVNDLARSDMAEVVEDAFRYDKIVFATTTYNGDIFPFMREFISHLTERNFSNRTIGFIENGSWAPVATKTMKEMLSKCKNLTLIENNVKILSSVKQENLDQIETLAEELMK